MFIHTNLQLKYQRIEDAWDETDVCMYAMIPFEKMIDGLFGKHSKIIKRKKANRNTLTLCNHDHQMMMMVMWKHKYKHGRCGTQWIASFVWSSCLRPRAKPTKIMVHNSMVRLCEFGYKSSSGFSSFPRLVLLPNSYARDIFMNCVCARACTVYTFCANRLTNKSIQKPNEMKQAG